MNLAKTSNPRNISKTNSTSFSSIYSRSKADLSKIQTQQLTASIRSTRNADLTVPPWNTAFPRCILCRETRIELTDCSTWPVKLRWLICSRVAKCKSTTVWLRRSKVSKLAKDKPWSKCAKVDKSKLSLLCLGKKRTRHMRNNAWSKLTLCSPSTNSNISTIRPIDLKFQREPMVLWNRYTARKNPWLAKLTSRLYATSKKKRHLRNLWGKLCSQKPAKKGSQTRNTTLTWLEKRFRMLQIQEEVQEQLVFSQEVVKLGPIFNPQVFSKSLLFGGKRRMISDRQPKTMRSIWCRV